MINIPVKCWIDLKIMPMSKLTTKLFTINLFIITPNAVWIFQMIFFLIFLSVHYSESHTFTLLYNLIETINVSFTKESQWRVDCPFSNALSMNRTIEKNRRSNRIYIYIYKWEVLERDALLRCVNASKYRIQLNVKHWNRSTIRFFVLRSTIILACIDTTDVFRSKPKPTNK